MHECTGKVKDPPEPVTVVVMHSAMFYLHFTKRAEYRVNSKYKPQSGNSCSSKLFYVTCQKRHKITYFCLLYFPRPLTSPCLEFIHNNVSPWATGPGGRRVSLEHLPKSSSPWLGDIHAALALPGSLCDGQHSASGTASTHSSSLKYNLAPKSLKGFWHLSAILTNSKPLTSHNSGWLGDLHFY